MSNNWRNSFNDRGRTSTKRNGSGGKKFPPRELEETAFSAEDEFYFRFIPAPGLPHFREYHWPKGSYPRACTANLPGFNGRCLWCETFPERTDRARQTLRRVMLGIDFRYAHIVPKPGVENRETMAPCYHQEPNPQVNRCPLCADNSTRVAERHGPRQKLMELNEGQWGALWATHSTLQNRCVAEDDEGGK